MLFLANYDDGLPFNVDAYCAELYGYAVEPRIGQTGRKVLYLAGMCSSRLRKHSTNEGRDRN